MSIIAVAGRIARDAQIKTLPDGSLIAEFSIAENIYAGGKEEAQFFNCAMFGARAEKVAPYIKKGGAATVFGTLHIRRYTAKDGSERTSADIRVNDITLQGGRQDGQAGQPPAPPQRRHPAPTQPQEAGAGFEDVPFMKHEYRLLG